MNVRHYAFIIFVFQVTLCIKYDNGCNGLTPPQCPDTLIHKHEHNFRKQRHIHSSFSSSFLTSPSTSSLSPPSNLHTLDVFTPQLHIINHVPECMNNHPSIVTTIYIYIALIAALLNILLLFVIITLYLRPQKICNRASERF